MEVGTDSELQCWGHLSHSHRQVIKLKNGSQTGQDREETKLPGEGDPDSKLESTLSGAV